MNVGHYSLGEKRGRVSGDVRYTTHTYVQPNILAVCGQFCDSYCGDTSVCYGGWTWYSSLIFMLRITDQYFWNFVFGFFFVVLAVLGVIILDTEARMSLADMSAFEVALLVLATWRLTLLLGSDTATKWFREQFYDLKKIGKGLSFELPKAGPRRVILDTLTNPVRSSVWIGASLTFCFLLSSMMVYPLLFLAVSGLVIIVNEFVGWLQGSGE